MTEAEKTVEFFKKVLDESNLEGHRTYVLEDFQTSMIKVAGLAFRAYMLAKVQEENDE